MVLLPCSDCCDDSQCTDETPPNTFALSGLENLNALDEVYYLYEFYEENTFHVPIKNVGTQYCEFDGYELKPCVWEYNDGYTQDKRQVNISAWTYKHPRLRDGDVVVDLQIGLNGLRFNNPSTSSDTIVLNIHKDASTGEWVPCYSVTQANDGSTTYVRADGVGFLHGDTLPDLPEVVLCVTNANDPSQDNACVQSTFAWGFKEVQHDEWGPFNLELEFYGDVEKGGYLFDTYNQWIPYDALVADGGYGAEEFAEVLDENISRLGNRSDSATLLELFCKDWNATSGYASGPTLTKGVNVWKDDSGIFPQDNKTPGGFVTFRHATPSLNRGSYRANPANITIEYFYAPELLYKSVIQGLTNEYSAPLDTCVTNIRYTQPLDQQTETPFVYPNGIESLDIPTGLKMFQKTRVIPPNAFGGSQMTEQLDEQGLYVYTPDEWIVFYSGFYNGPGMDDACRYAVRSKARLKVTPI